MGTKRNPGRFDCYAAADPDEPMFVLLGRDPLAPMLVRLWAFMRGLRRPHADPRIRAHEAEKQAEAESCAADMERWRDATG